MAIVKIRELNIRYEEIGSGRPLLGIHGYPPGSGRQVAAQCEPILERRTGWRRLYPDLLDYDNNSIPDWLRGPDDIADVLVEFMDAVAPGERFSVAGFSWGGYLARGVVQRRLEQIDGVLLAVPLIVWGVPLPPKQVVRHDAAFLAALQPGEEWLQDALAAHSVAVLEDIRTRFLANGMMPNAEVFARIDEKPFASDPDILSKPCPAPTLLVMGRQDSWVGYQQAWTIVNNFPRGTFALLDRAGHGLVFEQPTLWSALVNEWLDRVEEFASANLHSRNPPTAGCFDRGTCHSAPEY